MLRVATAKLDKNAKATFVRLDSQPIKPLCPIIIDGVPSMKACMEYCVSQNYSCSAVSYSDERCILWKYVIFDDKINLYENLYLKDTTNTFDASSCFNGNAVKAAGNYKML